jgi:Mce-associated membrane protein
MSGQGPRSARRRIAGERRSAGRSAETEANEAPDAEEIAPAGGPQTVPSDASPPPEPTVGPEPTTPERRPAGGPSWLVVAVAGVVALVLLGIAAILGLGVWDVREVHRADQVSQATDEAPGVAEKAAAAILSYGYTTLDADEKSAERYMTPAYARKYAATFRLVKQHAPALKAKVEASVKASGVTHADAHRVTVLLYVDQTTTSTANSGQPQLALNRVQMSMVERGGTWLVDDITSY